MNVHLLRTCAVTIRVSSAELHVSDTCLLHELYIMERYVTTYRLHELLICVYTRWIRNYYVS